MSGLGFGKLPRPLRQFDPEFALLSDKGTPRFESMRDAEAEELERIKLLRRQANRASPLFTVEQVRSLARRLNKARPPNSLASARYLHDQRQRIVGAIWNLVRDEN